MAGGLPHYLNSKASNNRYEPMYANLFQVTLIPPAAVSGGELLIEHVKKIGGLNTERGSEVVEQTYMGATRSYASGLPTGTTVDLSIDFTLNVDDKMSPYVLKTIRNWRRLIWNPLTGERGLKKDYVGSIIVTNFNRVGDIYWQRTFHDAFPTGDLPEMELDYSSGDPLELSGVVFRCEYWKEAIS